jgi:hypothetical protein
MVAGNLTIKLNRDVIPARIEANEPPGTRSQEFSYFNGGMEVVRGHQYVRPNGEFGASGRPDPKRIFEGGIWYRTRHPAMNWQEWIRYLLSDWRDRIYWWFGKEVD